MKKRIVLLPGDGIGREVIYSTKVILNVIAKRFHYTFEFIEMPIGGEAIDQYNIPLPEVTLEACQTSDAVLLGAVGGPKWDSLPAPIRPEKGLLEIRKKLGLFANLRPVKSFSALLHASPLKEKFIKDSDLLIVRELTGGLYFGKPSERRNNDEAVVDTLYYERYEMERIVEKAFQFARSRKKHLTSVDKANVLESSKMWREIVKEKSKAYPDVTVEHMYVDAASMKLITNPSSFDVIVTENMFGDILSDEASVLTGSLGMLPSASIRSDSFGLYEPVHGSAPDIAGKGIANPLGMILSAALMLRFSFGLEMEATIIEKAVNHTLLDGYHTPDLHIENGRIVSTDELVARIADKVEEEVLQNN
ncbi:3-isopropylmalate dehydrogenase [Pallidibacillus thermolactis]|uniref:3-isopropylmalate dehydrogenase n=1 Tax=Pallidibacillus thermolactis TaxID=251051 RepID=UPI0021D85E50|nr:3-isopropylmalate dehydrogenase [Pallidibacillus thermolactis]MCU9600825.1 3-isopropylmalate dehydrogenase [Pallidibacillus thermolactis subsp. kokeshiiformis]MED1672805.1 3-isopropylmalate dehydrogenase [Pallidibacillus thermolactis subsp. kokeshiiformis]